MDMQSDFDRLLFFEHARKTAETAYAKDPLDTENLTRWGGALLELSQFQSVSESKNMISDAISKLEEALEVNPQKHDAIWCLGNAYTSLGFVNPDEDEAKVYFDKATQCFQQAVDADPENELYRKSFEVSSKAPELHAQIHKQSALQQAMGPGPSTSTITKVYSFSFPPPRCKAFLPIEYISIDSSYFTFVHYKSFFHFVHGAGCFPGGKLVKLPCGQEVTGSSRGNSLLQKCKGSKKKKNNDMKYDIMGWVILAVGLVAWVGFAKSNMPPPGPPPPR